MTSTAVLVFSGRASVGNQRSPAFFSGSMTAGVPSVFPNDEAEIVIGAAIASGDPVAQVDKFRVGGVHCDTQLLQTLPGHGLTGGFVFVYMAAAGKVPAAVHIAGVLPQVQQHLRCPLAPSRSKMGNTAE